MTQKQADNCLTLAYWLADCMTDAEFREFWKDPDKAIRAERELFHYQQHRNGAYRKLTFGSPGDFVISGALTDGLGLRPTQVTRCSIATALVGVMLLAGYEAVS